MKPGETKTIKGESYRITVFKVVSRKPDGTPHMCMLVADDEKIPVAEGDEFITVFVHENVLKRTAN